MGARGGMHYRSDIDGLRAVAVISVAFYHFGIPGFSGGFAGVDVFFVISGYLITTLIAKDLNAGTFSLLAFYNRRVRRIVPAMLVVLAATMIAGCFFLLPGDYASLGTSAAYSAAALANIYFLNHTGYFDRAADMLPLLHMWSLSVEEQFYLVWPLLLAGMLFVAGKHIRTVAVVTFGLLLVSLGLSIHSTATNPKAAFFLTHLRAWELALGALIVFLPAIPKPTAHWKNELPTLCGALLIVASTAGLAAILPFPGLGAIPACIGAALIVWPREIPTMVGLALSTPSMRFVGLISYSLYLWHWPLVVFYRHYAGRTALSAIEVFAIAVVSIALAYLCWRFIEQPPRRWKVSPRTAVGWGVAGSSAAVVTGLMLAAAGGFPSRLSQQAQDLSSLERMWEWKCPENVSILETTYCAFGAGPWATATRKAILWGDSHAEHFAPLIEPLAEQAGISVLLLRACPPIVMSDIIHLSHATIPNYTQECSEKHNKAIALFQPDQSIEFIILAASWANWSTRLSSPDRPNRSRTEAASLVRYGLAHIIQRLSLRGRRIVILGDVPQWSGDPIPCALAFESHFIVRQTCSEQLTTIARKSFDRHSGPVYESMRTVAAGRKDVVAILPGDHLCDQISCISRIEDVFLYRDGSHLRRNLPGATKRALAEMIELDRVFENAGGGH